MQEVTLQQWAKTGSFWAEFSLQMFCLAYGVLMIENFHIKI